MPSAVVKVPRAPNLPTSLQASSLLTQGKGKSETCHLGVHSHGCCGPHSMDGRLVCVARAACR